MTRPVLLALLATTGLALVLPTTLATVAAGAGLASLAVLAAWARALRRGVTVEFAVARRWIRGEQGTATVTVRNRSRWPAPRVRVDAKLGIGGLSPNLQVVELAVPARAGRTLQVPVEAVDRGRWTPPATTVRLSDPWGLIAVERSLPAPEPLVVLPTIHPIRRLAIPNAAPVPVTPDNESLVEDPLAIIGVRDYRPGDPLRSIHWPATAASGTLVRREVERAQARDLLVVLDLAQASWRGQGGRAFESAVTVAASLLVDALGQRQPAALCTSLPPRGRGGRATVARFSSGGGRHHLDAMLIHLAGVRRHQAVDAAELLTSHASRAEPGTTAVLITAATLPDHTAARALRLRAAGISPVVVHVIDPALTGPPIDGLSATRPTSSVIPSRTVTTDRPVAELVL
ncbi:MAG: DUF58 domain-containing protein [Nitriliruptoraceae bacterium]|nr:DUF58 domain-containing protein [Nitriliruptoraceae bacterium]